MKKCISAIAAASVLACVATAVPASAAEVTKCDFIITADKTNVHVGDVVTFTLKIKANGPLYGLEGTLSLPDGLEFVKNSGALANGVKDTLGWDDIAVTESDIVIFTGFASAPKDNSNKEIAIATFQCKATKSGITGDVTLGGDVYGMNSDFEECNSPVTAANVKVYGIKEVPAKASTCTQKGYKKHYACECGKELYKDAAGTTKTTLAEVEEPLAAHQPVEVVDAKYLKSEANCTSPAVYYKSCKVCGEKTAETFTSGDKDSTKHTNIVTENAVEATCQTTGYTGDKVCGDCGTEIEKGTETPLSDHKGGEATCTAKAVCDTCGEEYGEVNPDNHGELEIKNAKDATETEEGYTGDKVCKDCSTTVEEGKAIPKLSNNPTDPSTPTDPSNPASSDNSTSNAGTSSGSSASSAGNSTASDPAASNPATGVTLAVAPILVATGAMVVIYKSKKK